MVTQDGIEAAIVAVGEAISNGDNASEVALAALEAAGRTAPMADDIAELIERLQDIAKQGHVFGGWSDIAKEAAAALSHLTAQPLPPMLAPPTNFGAAMGVIYGMRGEIQRLTAEVQRLTTPSLPDEIAGLIADVEEIIREGLETPNLSRRNNLRKIVTSIRALAQENERLKLANAEEMACWERAANRTSALVQENADIQGRLTTMTSSWNDLKTENERLKAIIDGCDKEGELDERRIAELEAERDEWKQCAEVEAGVRREFVALSDKLEAERDAAKASVVSFKALTRGAYNERDAIGAKTVEECAQIAERSACDELSAGAQHAAAAIRARAQTDEAVDTTDIPETGEEFFKRAKVVHPHQGDYADDSER